MKCLSTTRLLHAARAVLDTELAEIACTGSDAPCEDALGQLKDAAALCETVQTAIWLAVTGPGQVKKGDSLRFTVGDKPLTAKAKLILHPGTDQEEVVYDIGRNFYFITGMVARGTSSHKDVEVLVKPCRCALYEPAVLTAFDAWLATQTRRIGRELTLSEQRVAYVAWVDGRASVAPVEQASPVVAQPVDLDLIVRDIAELDYSSDIEPGLMEVRESDLRAIIARHTAPPAATSAPGAAAPDILEALSHLARERDDLTLEEAVTVLRSQWRTARGRSERALVLQIAVLLAGAPAILAAAADLDGGTQ